MIGRLKGIVASESPDGALVIDVNGVGYEVLSPLGTLGRAPRDPDGRVTLLVHTNVREDAITLFGFHSPPEKLLFEKLISVSGIGPKLGITILSGLATGDLVSSIRNGQVDHLVRIPGVGKKTAERMVLELRDKLDNVSVGLPASPEERAAPAMTEIEQDVLSALINLGCNRPSAEAAIRKAKAGGTTLEFEPLFRRSLELVR